MLNVIKKAAAAVQRIRARYRRAGRIVIFMATFVYAYFRLDGGVHALAKGLVSNTVTTIAPIDSLGWLLIAILGASGWAFLASNEAINRVGRLWSAARTLIRFWRCKQK